MTSAWILGLHLYTHHLASVPELAPVNPGIYMRHPNGLTVGVYRNSYRMPSLYGAYTLQTPSERFALTVGVVSGYAPGLMPLVVPSVTHPLGRHGRLRLAYLPKPPQYGQSAGLHLTWERKL